MIKLVVIKMWVVFVIGDLDDGKYTHYFEAKEGKPFHIETTLDFPLQIALGDRVRITAELDCFLEQLQSDTPGFGEEHYFCKATNLKIVP